MLTYLTWLAFAIGSMLVAVVVARVFVAYRQRQQPDSRRGLFLYSDGKNTRSIDPIAAILGLESDPKFRFDRHPKLAAEGDKEAIAIVAAAVRSVFGIPEYTAPGKPGLTVVECYRLLQAFALYVDLQKKSTSPLPTFALSTDATPQSSSEPTTNDSSLSGSTASAPE